MAVRAWQDTIQLKTYPLGPEDPNPPFQRQGASWATYPYPMQDDLLEGPGEMKDWIALHVENEYLHAIVLPELGGHLHSLYDKVTKREVFYCNHVVKYGLVAIRGAWISGGIEFNFPTGHTHTTVDKVSWEVGGDKREGWVMVGNIDRLSRMEWSVRLSLKPGERRLREQVWLSNPTPFKQRYWFWNNSAVPAREDLHLVYPARKAQTGGKIVDYPIADGKDISWYTALNHAADIFTLDVKEDYFGCHYVKSDFGLVHVAGRRLLRGKKYFTWGTSDDGMMWVDLLTDDDGQYVEIQAGPFETQSIWEFLEPFETVCWDEYWFPEHGMGGWVAATEDAVLQFEIRDRKITLGALPTKRLKRAELSLEAGGATLWSQEASVTPRRRFRAEIDLLPGCDPSASFVFTLSDLDEGLVLARYEHPPWHARQPKVAETGESVVSPPKPEEECTAEELVVRATDALRRLEFSNARRLCQKAIALEPGLSAAHLGIGFLDLRSGRFASARDHLEKALRRDRENDEAWYYLGLARLGAARPEEAVDAWWEARRRQPDGSPAHQVLARLEDVARRADTKIPLSGVPHSIHYGRYGLRKWRLESATDADWDTPIANPVETFAAWARGDVQNWLEVACGAHPGSIPEAIQILELAREHCPRAEACPMTHYFLGHWYHQLGHPDKADAAYARAKACPPDFCFPSRLEELQVLEAAVARDPGDWKARYYLGNLLASLDRTDEAMQQWREAVKLDAGFAVLHRNLGLGALRWENKPEEAIEHYRHAIARNPNDFRYYLDLATILLQDVKRPEEALALLHSAPAALQEKWQVAARIAEVLAQLRRYNEALDILGRHKFFPWEGARQMHALYANCLAGLAEEAAAAADHPRALAHLEAAMEYPRNLSVGKPVKPQDARAYLLAAREAAALGDQAKHDRYLAIAADEAHHEPCTADLYKIRALRDLGRLADASELEATLRDWARKNLDDPHHGSTASAILEDMRMK